MTDIRDALQYPKAQVSLFLPEGSHFRLEGVELAVHKSNVILRSEGAGATIDAQNRSRHFDVSRGGRLHLERVHLVNGGGESRGGSILVRSGSGLTTNNVRISSSIARSSTSAHGGAIAAEERNGIHELMSQPIAHPSGVEAVVLSPDMSKLVTCSRYRNGIRQWDPVTLELLATNVDLDLRRGCTLVFSPDSSLLIVGDDDSRLHVWEVPLLLDAPHPSSSARCSSPLFFCVMLLTLLLMRDAPHPSSDVLMRDAPHPTHDKAKRPLTPPVPLQLSSQGAAAVCCSQHTARHAACIQHAASGTVHTAHGTWRVAHDT
jgi:hypothetical protein